MTDSQPNQEQNKGSRARLRDPADTGPDAMVLPGATPRPRSSGTDVNPGAGRASLSPVEALTQIRALCDAIEQRYRDPIHHRVNTASVRAVLDAVSVDATPAQGTDREALARRFHEAYERLAPSFGYQTRQESAVPWEDVPEQNKRLMIAAAGEVLTLVTPTERDRIRRILTDALPADARWVPWVEGVLDRIEHEEAS